MDALELLKTRISCPRLEAPGPDPDQLRTLLEAAIRAPDHGMLRPWRFLVVEGEDRGRLGEIVARARLEREPGTDVAVLDKLRANPLRAPTVLVVVAETTRGHKVPEKEQVMATAVAAGYVMLAAHALGLGAMWRTGEPASWPEVKRALGFADKDEIVGFIYLGSPACAPKRVPDENPDAWLRKLP